MTRITLRIFIDDQEIDHAEADEPTEAEACELAGMVMSRFEDMVSDRQDARDNPDKFNMFKRLVDKK